MLEARGNPKISINEADLEIISSKSSGAGGQHINKTKSCVRIVHKPSQIAVQCQDERSWHQNREKAFRLLRARLEAKERHSRAKKRNKERQGQIGDGDRSLKIRTYNEVDDRIVDHRNGKKFRGVKGFMSGKMGLGR